MKTLFFSLLLVSSYAMAENQLIGVPVQAKKLELLPEPTSEVAITPVTPVTPTTTTAVLLAPPPPPTMVAENNVTPAPTPAPPTMTSPSMQPPATPAQPLPTIQAIQKTNLMPAQLAPTAPPQPVAVTKPQYKVCQGELPYSPEVAVVLSNDKFFPSRVKLFEGQPARLIFATTNRKPAALIIERLKFQRWIAKEPKLSSPESGKFELNRELVTNRVTEVTFEPKRGSYTFHDAVSGASGEILVE